MSVTVGYDVFITLDCAVVSVGVQIMDASSLCKIIEEELSQLWGHYIFARKYMYEN